jgi:YhcN/YlaJ family sporulation lipoprotein
MYKYKWKQILLIVLVFMTITACGTIQSHNQGTPSGMRGAGGTSGSSAASNGQSGTNLTVKNVGSGATPVGMHHNTTMAVNIDIANQIATIPEVKSAYVVATESNIYVAVRLKDDYHAPPNQGQSTENQAAYTSDPGPRSDVISGITGNSYDLKSQNAGTMTSTSDIQAKTKQKIVDKVRSLSAPSLHHVFVSANPDLRTIFERYTQDVKQGKAISGAIDDFNILAQRIFPTTDGTGAYGGSTSSGAPGKVYNNSGDGITGRISSQR